MRVLPQRLRANATVRVLNITGPANRSARNSYGAALYLRTASPELSAMPDADNLYLPIAADLVDDDIWPHRREFPGSFDQTGSATFWKQFEPIARRLEVLTLIV